MDALTFGTPVLLRHLTFSEARVPSSREQHCTRAALRLCTALAHYGNGLLAKGALGTADGELG